MVVTKESYSRIIWPSIECAGAPPVWTGRGFDVGGTIHPVLANDVGLSGWSEELAELINVEVAPDRPLGIASRRHAIGALRRTQSVGCSKTVMEIGCANGFLVSDIAFEFPGTAVIGTDYALPPLQALAARLQDVPLVQLDVVRSKFPDAFCDAIVMLNVLEHIEDDVAALRQIRRMLKPGGVLILEVPSSPSLFDDFDRLVGHFRRYTMRDLMQKLQSVGFSIDRKSHLGFFVFPAFWGLVQYKKLMSRPEGIGADVLKSRIKVGRRSVAQDLIFSLETALRPIIPMPFGVRCLVTATA